MIFPDGEPGSLWAVAQVTALKCGPVRVSALHYSPEVRIQRGFRQQLQLMHVPTYYHVSSIFIQCLEFLKVIQNRAIALIEESIRV